MQTADHPGSARLCQAFETIAPKARGPLNGLVKGLFLGLMDNDDFALLTLRSYELDTNGFDDQEFNLSGLGDDEAALHTNAFEPGCRLLVVGCAGGREVIALTRMGFEVAGVDPSQMLVEAARRNCDAAGVTAQIHVAHNNLLPDGLRQFDGILIGRGVYHHIPGSSERIAMLKQCRELTAASSPIVVRGIRARTEGTLSGPWRGADLLRRIRRADRLEPGDSLGANSYFFGSSEASLRSELAAADFELTQWFAPTAQSPLADATGTACTAQTSHQ